MATAVEPLKATRSHEAEQRVVIRGVDWDGYEALLRLVGDGHVRITYDGEDAELMSPSYDHEDFKKMIARLIETLTLELNIPCQAAGSTTRRKRLKAKGLEPDECYYISNSERVAGRRIDLTVDPPPDLAVEIEISRSALDRMAIYAALGVPEVWRYDGRTLRVERLRPDGTYAEVPASVELPSFPPGEVVRWLEKGRGQGQTAWLREFREWVRAELLPRHEGRV
jgi:Uma2 family endonuclease